MSYTILAGATLTALLALGAASRGTSAAAPRPPEPKPPMPHATGAVQDQRPVQAPPQSARRPRVEIVFALDTTGSMAGLIEGAKQKIWSIASFVARGQPTPDLRIGLVAYRDRGDAYVTRVHDLDADLDQVHERLRRFRADGGGDTPEHVGKALHDAVHAVSWTDRREVVKIVYLVGDAPPHTDYGDGFDYAGAARAAAKRGIQVHAIRCGGDRETEAAWRRVASLAGGQYLSIGQDGGMRDLRTPFDDKLARLHDQLSETVVTYGARRDEAEAILGGVATAAPALKAARASTLAAQGKALGSSGDLVGEVASGAVKLESLRKEDLPAEMRFMDAATQKRALEDKSRRRHEVQTEIRKLARDREEFLSAREKDSDGFDVKVKATTKKSVADNPQSGLSL